MARKIHKARNTGSVKISNTEGMLDIFGPKDNSLTLTQILNLSAVYAAVSKIASTVAILPYEVFKPVGKTDKTTKIDDHPLSYMMNISMDGQSTSMSTREAIQVQALLLGNSFLEIRKGTQPRMDLIDPSLIEITEDEDEKYIKVQNNLTGKQEKLNNRDFFHIPALSLGGFFGIAILKLLSESSSIDLYAQKYGKAYFRNPSPPGFLTRDRAITEAERVSLRKEWRESHSEIANWHNIGVLSGGMSWVKACVDPQNCQFLDVRRYGVQDIARWFSIPPSMLGVNDQRVDEEQERINFATYELQKYIKRWESEIELKFGLRKLNLIGKFSLNPILNKMNAEARRATSISMLNSGALTPNEYRISEGLNPHTDCGDTPLIMASQLGSLKIVETSLQTTTPTKGVDPLPTKDSPTEGALKGQVNFAELDTLFRNIYGKNND